MIVVIADDITGAAEIAGVGLRYGLTVELSTSVKVALPNVQLWVVALNTRSMGSKEAENSITITVRHLIEAGIIDIFKKTDSVLRGHIVKELAAQLRAEDKKKVILCPANPEGGRKIVNGVYLINDIQISETNFARDPEFPITTSVVKEILDDILLKENNIRIFDTCSIEDLHKAVKQQDNETILAGSAAFFSAYLDNRKLMINPVMSIIPEFSKVLYVCGSTYDKSKQVVEKARDGGAKVAYISPLWLDEPDLDTKLNNCALWLVRMLEGGAKPILAVDAPVINGREATTKIKDAVSEVVKKVLSLVSVNELVVEGGATAFAIVEALNYNRFTPISELAKGVVRMKINEMNDMYITIKPGSYEFPETVWKFSK